MGKEYCKEIYGFTINDRYPARTLNQPIRIKHPILCGRRVDQRNVVLELRIHTKRLKSLRTKAFILVSYFEIEFVRKRKIQCIYKEKN